MMKLFLLLMQFVLTAKRNLLIRRAVRKDMALIGDFGCGHFPSKFANVLVDQSDSEDEQRGGLKLRKTGHATFRHLDLNVFPYPFPDKYFDFIICNHVLEHLEDPVRTCAEFSRIAKAGYLEVPYYCVDLYIRNNDVIHKWLCASGGADGPLCFIGRRAFLERLPPRPLNLFLRFILQLDNLSLVWRGEIRASYLEVVKRP
jgi:SAM-dependent methyltransferase